VSTSLRLISDRCEPRNHRVLHNYYDHSRCTLLLHPELCKLVFLSLILLTRAFCSAAPLKLFAAMAQPVKPDYLPSSFLVLIDNKDCRLMSSTSAWAFLHSGVSHDSKHHSLERGGLHVAYSKLFQETRDKTPGETYSQADIVYRMLADTFDSVSTLIYRLSVKY